MVNTTENCEECPDVDCHDKVQASYYTLNGREGTVGLIKQFEDFKQQITKDIKAVSAAIDSKLSKATVFCLVIAFGLSTAYGVLDINKKIAVLSEQIKKVDVADKNSMALVELRGQVNNNIIAQRTTDQNIIKIVDALNELKMAFVKAGINVEIKSR